MDEYEVVPIDGEMPDDGDVIPTEDEEETAVIDDEEYDPTEPTDPDAPGDTDEGAEPEPEFVIGPDEEDVLPTEDEEEAAVIDDEEWGGGDEPEPDINDNEAEITMVGAVREGDVFPALKIGSSLMGFAPAGWGDRLQTDVDLASQAAEEAKEVAEATGQHFWEDSNGAHVTEITKEDWQAEEAKPNPFADVSDAKPYHNLLMNSLGILLRTALKNLVSITRSAIAFFDGQGNDAANVVASFGKDGAQIGKLDAGHAIVSDDGLKAYGANGTTVIAHLGYGDTVNSAGETVKSFFFTAGRRGNGNIGRYSIAEGASIVASGEASHASGLSTTASGFCSHAEGHFSTATGSQSHAEGNSTQAVGPGSHAEGMATQAVGFYSHAEGSSSYASGTSSHAGGSGTRAVKSCQTVVGKYNVDDTGDGGYGDYAVIVGNGTSDSARSNALAVKWSGDVECGTVNGVDVTAIPTPQSGVVAMRSVAAGSSESVSITFSEAFDAAPNVICGLQSTQTQLMGNCSCVVTAGSATGFTVALVNNSSSARNIGCYWIAM